MVEHTSQTGASIAKVVSDSDIGSTNDEWKTLPRIFQGSRADGDFLRGPW